jgi:hypothetical protein
LRDVAGIVRIAAHPQAKPIEMGLISDEEALERRGVPLPRRCQQLVIGGRSGHGSGWNVRTHR